MKVKSVVAALLACVLAAGCSSDADKFRANLEEAGAKQEVVDAFVEAFKEAGADEQKELLKMSEKDAKSLIVLGVAAAIQEVLSDDDE